MFWKNLLTFPALPALNMWPPKASETHAEFTHPTFCQELMSGIALEKITTTTAKSYHFYSSLSALNTVMYFNLHTSTKKEMLRLASLHRWGN